MMTSNTPLAFSAWLFLIAVLSGPPIGAQTLPPSAEQARVNEGRTLLARGNATGAAALGKTLLAEYPKSAVVLEFAVDAEIARAGMFSGLAIYDAWVTANTVEDPRALHQVARSALREAAAGHQSPATRVQALQALADDGDVDAAATLAGNTLGQEAGPGLLAPAGNEQAITTLIAELQTPSPRVQRPAIVALGASHSRRAVNPLVAVLADPSPEVRAAAAQALGKLDATQAIAPLKALLDDPVFPVHYQAAAALFALGDLSGLSWLRQLENNDEPGLRLAAAQATKGRTDASWIALVRDLTTAADPEIRREAAVLLAPHDPETAKTVLKPLLTHANIAEREAATESYLQYAETDLPTLRAYVRKGNADTRLQAAIRLLELTR
jgi:HEAT repeat protein